MEYLYLSSDYSFVPENYSFCLPAFILQISKKDMIQRKWAVLSEFFFCRCLYLQYLSHRKI